MRSCYSPQRRTSYCLTEPTRTGGVEHSVGDGAAVQMRGGAAGKGGVRGVGFIRLVTGTT